MFRWLPMSDFAWYEGNIDDALTDLDSMTETDEIEYLMLIFRIRKVYMTHTTTCRFFLTPAYHVVHENWWLRSNTKKDMSSIMRI